MSNGAISRTVLYTALNKPWKVQIPTVALVKCDKECHIINLVRGTRTVLGIAILTKISGRNWHNYAARINQEFLL